MKYLAGDILIKYKENKGDLFLQGVFLGYYATQLDHLDFKFKNILFKAKNLKNDLELINNIRTKCFESIQDLKNLQPCHHNAAQIKLDLLTSYEDFYKQLKLDF